MCRLEVVGCSLSLCTGLSQQEENLVEWQETFAVEEVNATFSSLSFQLLDEQDTIVAACRYNFRQDIESFLSPQHKEQLASSSTSARDQLERVLDLDAVHRGQVVGTLSATLTFKFLRRVLEGSKGSAGKQVDGKQVEERRTIVSQPLFKPTSTRPTSAISRNVNATSKSK
mmetsp:Transcript_12197/g.42434  ORF Transcript_12197/g.42434 Transcript_12197/m.42434 type:complete len:171 (-) Transcript_12197:876-1388(-)